MYSFHHRGDTDVIDEPFYAYYLHKSGADHPGRDEILSSQSTDFATVADAISVPSRDRDHLFVKNMAHHLIDCDWGFMKPFVNIILLRNPRQLISSFSQVIPNPTMRDIGVKQQHDIFQELRTADAKCLVVDSGDLLKDPPTYMQLLCEQLGIPYSESMVSWPAGAIAADGVWEKYWYKTVHASTGLQPQASSNRPLPAECEDLYQESLPYYEELSKYALRIQ